MWKAWWFRLWLYMSACATARKRIKRLKDMADMTVCGSRSTPAPYEKAQASECDIQRAARPDSGPFVASIYRLPARGQPPGGGGGGGGTVPYYEPHMQTW